MAPDGLSLVTKPVSHSPELLATRQSGCKTPAVAGKPSCTV